MIAPGWAVTRRDALYLEQLASRNPELAKKLLDEIADIENWIGKDGDISYGGLPDVRIRECHKHRIVYTPGTKRIKRIEPVPVYC